MLEGSTKGGIYEVNFVYNVKMDRYANSSSDISMLYDIAKTSFDEGD